MASASKSFRDLDKPKVQGSRNHREEKRGRVNKSADNNPYKKNYNTNGEVKAGIVKSSFKPKVNPKGSFKQQPNRNTKGVRRPINHGVDVSKYFDINASIIGGNNDYTVTLEEALKEVKLLDRAIKRINFKGKRISFKEKSSMLNSLKDLTKRKKDILYRIAVVNVHNSINVSIGGRMISMPMFLARVHLKETKELINKLTSAKFSYGPQDKKTKKHMFNTDMEVTELDRVILNISTELVNASKRITLDIPR